MKNTNQKYANLKRTKSFHQLLNMQYEFIKATSGLHISKKINKNYKVKVSHGWHIKVATIKIFTYALSFYVKSASIKNRNKKHAYVGSPSFIPSTCDEREISMWYEMLMKLKVVPI